MADSKISGLTEITSLEDADRFVIARAGSLTRGVTYDTLALGIGGMTVLYDQILSGAAASFDVQNIPQGYKNLRLVAQMRSAKASVGNDNLLMRYNNDSSSIYDTQRASTAGGGFSGSNASAQSSFDYVGICPAATSPSGGIADLYIDIANYASTTFRKQFVSNWTLVRADDSADIVRGFNGGQWRSTAALNRITLFFSADNILTGSRLTIYGMGGNAEEIEQVGDDLMLWAHFK